MTNSTKWAPLCSKETRHSFLFFPCKTGIFVSNRKGSSKCFIFYPLLKDGCILLVLVFLMLQEFAEETQEFQTGISDARFFR